MAASKRVMASMGITVNLGNYQSVRIDASSEEDVPGGEKDAALVERVYGRLWEEVESQIAARRVEAKALADGVTKAKGVPAGPRLVGGEAWTETHETSDDLPPDVR